MCMKWATSSFYYIKFRNFFLFLFFYRNKKGAQNYEKIKVS